MNGLNRGSQLLNIRIKPSKISITQVLMKSIIEIKSS